MIKTRHSGQTLIETLMGLFVVTIGVVSSVTLFVASTRASGDTEDRTIAINLAREGIEMIRGIRDDNWLVLDAEPNTINWDKDLDTGGSDSTSTLIYNPLTRQWSLDLTANDFNTSCSGGAFFCADIYQDSNDRYLQFEDGDTPDPADTKTKYQRLITINNICAQGSGINIKTGGQNCPAAYEQRKIGLQIVVEVQWKSGELVQNIALEDQLYQWKEIRHD